MEQEKFSIYREIGIDMGHRVTNHASKCRNVHGHRYRIEAHLSGYLVEEGSSEGMVMDFGFVKEIMMQFVDANFDHRLVLWGKDPLTRFIFGDGPALQKEVEKWGVYLVEDHILGKVTLVNFVPTVENLCQCWFNLMGERVAMRSNGQATLVAVKAWETPNGSAVYPG